MLARLGDRLGAFFRATAPDPLVIAILLTLLTFALAWIHGNDPDTGGDVSLPRVIEIWIAPGGDEARGLWSLLRFGMQMCVILVAGHALACSPPVARAIRWIAGLAGGPRKAVALTCLVAMLASLVNWGFGLIVGAILARDVTRELRRRGINAPAGLLAAAGYAGFLVWHAGLSGSAPLKATTEAGQIDILGPELGAQIGAIPVSQTIFTPLNLVITGGLIVFVPLLLTLMCPKDTGYESPPPAPPESPKENQPGAAPDTGRIPAFLERSPIVVWIIVLPALAWIAWRFAGIGLDALTLETAMLLFFALGLAMHASARSYANAVEEGARACSGIIIQFPIYAGIMALMIQTEIGEMIAEVFTDLAKGSETGLSLMTFASAGLVNLFVPSGGGQWAIQGPIGMQAALDSGVNPARIVMAVAYGDQLTNMLQPFWALPVLAITRARAQDVIGYTAIVMVAAGAWIALWLVLL